MRACRFKLVCAFFLLLGVFMPSIIITLSAGEHPLRLEEQREPPDAPPPVRLFVSNEARFAIAQGWLCGEGYDESRVATHAEAVALLMFLAGGDPHAPLNGQDFMRYLRYVFHDLPDAGLFGHHADDLFHSHEVTWAELARVAYRLRGFGVAEVDPEPEQEPPTPSADDEPLQH